MSRRTISLAGLTLLLVPATLAAQENWRSVATSRSHRGEKELRVDVRFGAGRLDIKPGPAGSLYKATLHYDPRAFRPVTEYRDGRLRVGLNTERGTKVRSHKAGEIALALGPEVPITLDLEFGAAEADVDLGGLRIRRVEVSTGASQTSLRFSRPNPEPLSVIQIEVGAAAFRAEGLGNANAERISVDGGLGDVVLDFSGEWQRDMTADIDMGLGALTLRVPEGVGLHVMKDGLLAAFDSQGLIKRGKGYYSPDWDTASRRLTIRVDAALGSIDLQWVKPVAASLP
ncbi:MAG TPA: hypothetical protein VF192_01780 [Longimicrobiales bacterium]|jgi:hypothetical protein